MPLPVVPSHRNSQAAQRSRPPLLFLYPRKATFQQPLGLTAHNHHTHTHTLLAITTAKPTPIHGTRLKLTPPLLHDYSLYLVLSLKKKKEGIKNALHKMAALPSSSCKTLHYTRPAQKLFLSLSQILTDFPSQIWQPYQQPSPRPSPSTPAIRRIASITLNGFQAALLGAVVPSRGITPRGVKSGTDP